MSLSFVSRGLGNSMFRRARHGMNLNAFGGLRSGQPQQPTTELAMNGNFFQLRSFASKKHKNLLQHAKGFRGRSKNCFRVAIRRVQKSWQYAFRDRRRKKREWNKLWIQRIQAGVRQYGYSYSQFYGMYNKMATTSTATSSSTTKNMNHAPHLQLNRKVLAELAAHEPFAFRSVVQVVESQANKQQKL